MEPVLIYCLKVNLALALFYLFYRICFEGDTFLGLRRFLLLAFYPVAFLYPFVDITTWLIKQPQMSDLIQLYESSVYPVVSPFLGSISVLSTIDTVKDEGSQSISDILFISGIVVYLTGVLIFFLRNMAEVGYVFHLLFTRERKRINGIRICVLPDKEEPFSFLRWVFISGKNDREDRWRKVWLHECMHVRQFHSLDVLLSQSVIMLCWINPFAWWLKKEICINHEFLADRGVICNGANKKEYQYYLIGMDRTGTAAAELYNYFSVLPLKKRIIMLNKKQTRCIGQLKGLLFIPLVAVLLVSNHMGAMTRIASDVLEKNLPESFVNPVLPVLQDSLKKETVKADSVNSKIHTIVDKCAEFSGGQGALYTFINKTMKYPPEALKDSIAGRVVIEFVVNTDGSLCDIKLLKSRHKLLDDEAVRIVKAMPKWKPGENEGKPVRSRFTLPLNFTLK